MNNKLSAARVFPPRWFPPRLVGGGIAAALAIAPYALVAVASGMASRPLIECALATIPIAAVAGVWHAPDIASRRHGLDWTIVGRATASVVVLMAIEVALLGMANGKADAPQSAFVRLVFLGPYAYVLILPLAMVWVRLMQRATSGVALAPLVGHGVSEPVLGAYLRFESHALRLAVARWPAVDIGAKAGSVAESLEDILDAIDSFTDRVTGGLRRTPAPPTTDTAGWLVRLDAALAELDALTLDIASSGRLTEVRVMPSPDRRYPTTLGGELLAILTRTTVGRWELEERLHRTGIAMPDHGRRLHWQTGTAR